MPPSVSPCSGCSMRRRRWFVGASARQIAQALATFAAVFSALASTGLLLTGRLGFAIVTIGRHRDGGAGADARPPGAERMAGQQAGPASSVETDLLAMRLDHATGEVDGRVKRGDLAGRELASLGLTAAAGAAGRGAARGSAVGAAARGLSRPALARVAPVGPRRHRRARRGTLDERTALDILGLAPDAGEAQIKAAHRQLMARLHPDHGGSAYLAAQLNQARDYLLQL